MTRTALLLALLASPRAIPTDPGADGRLVVLSLNLHCLKLDGTDFATWINWMFDGDERWGPLAE